MRVVISSRIFAPEPSAASFRLEALATAFTEAGDDVRVLTVKPVRALRAQTRDQSRKFRVRRAPVLRDRTGYVRGYLQYLSFDIPLFFRILLGRKPDLVITEPPPTTGLFVRLACALRRTPYAYYAADIWSDAMESTSAWSLVVHVVRAMERFALQGARDVLSVNAGVTARARQIAPKSRVHTVGNGIDLETFSPEGPAHTGTPYFVYAGTASEWQGASIFIEAFAEVLRHHPNARLVFLGHGRDWPALQVRAAELPDGAVEFVRTVPPHEAAAWLRGSTASIASIRPDSGYTFAFPTKVFASWGTGSPVIFAGEGPVYDYMSDHAAEARLGEHCHYDLSQVIAAMRKHLNAPLTSDERVQLGEWASVNVGLQAIAEKSVRLLSGVLN